MADLSGAGGWWWEVMMAMKNNDGKRIERSKEEERSKLSLFEFVEEGEGKDMRIY